MALVCCNRQLAWWSAGSRMAALLSSLVECPCVEFGLYDVSDLRTCLLMRWWGLGALAAVGPTGVCLLDYCCSCIQLHVLLSPYLCFVPRR